MAQQGDMWFRLMFDHRQFVQGMSLTRRELQEVRILAGDLAGGVGNLVPQFDKLARLARADGEAMKVAANSLGKLSLKSREALVASRRFAQQLDFEADVLRERKAAGEQLSAAEEQRLRDNERISLAFQEGIDRARTARAKELLGIRKVRNAAREERKEKERLARVNKTLATTQGKYLAGVKQNSRIMEEQRKQQLQRGQAFFDKVQAHKAAADKKYLTNVRFNSKVEEDLRRRALANGKNFFDYVQSHKIAADKKYLAMVKHNSKIMEEQRQAAIRRGGRATAMSAMQRQLLGLARQITVITIAYKALNQLKSGLKLALDVEKAQKQFEVYLGNLEDAKSVMGDIRSIAATTPLTISVSTSAVRTLLQYGVTAGDVTERLRQLGNIAGADTERMQRLSLAFGQITAAGRLQGQELRQLVEAGFNPLQTLSRMTGESMLELKLRMAEGKVSVEEINGALEAATSEGGRFDDMMKQIAEETTAGKLMLIAGAVEEIKIELAEGVHEAKPFLDSLIGIMQARRLSKQAGMHGTGGILSWLIPAEEGQQEKGFVKYLLSKALGQAATGAAGVLGDALGMDTTDAAKSYKESLQDQTVELLNQFRQKTELLSITKEELELSKLIAELDKKGMTAESMRLEDAQESLKLQKEEHEMRKRAEAIAATYEKPQVALQRQLGDVTAMQDSGMIPQWMAEQERDRLTKDFVEAQVDKVVESQKETAKVASKGSKEEFQIMRDITMSKADSADKREEARHKAKMEASEALKNSIEALPEDLATFFPIAI